ncbi:family 14 glycosylhydrolase [Herbiconiux solani]|uniref:family 14 glycosylhydrolase n=1 Tax=Herbiconiux solani TaxID=661329 RepID=UPI0008255E50|nr:family 14 glycosylhydrolase [Herbiconiux solani]
MALRTTSRIGLATAAIALLASGLSAAPLGAPPGHAASPGAAQTVNVMAPLWIDDWASSGPQWTSFTDSLAIASGQGVDAVAVDVWWGKAEPARGSFDWAYYDKLFAAVTSAGLELVPMMSFHQCGTNVADVCNIAVPDFVFEPIQICGVAGWCSTIPADNAWVSEYGNTNRESPSPWGMGSDRALQDMGDFMEAFEQHYSSGATDYRGRIQEITVSTGPAGELRYPSYATHDKTAPGDPAGYPNRGTFQSYSTSAVRDFADWAVARYGSVAGVATAWSIPGLTYTAITPPSDHDRFITSGAYRSLRYGKDFTRWYSESLLRHGRQVMLEAIGAFDDEFASVPLGLKVPGVHWQTMAGSPIRRAPEVAAGLIHTDQAYDDASTGHGYDGILALVHDLDVNGDGVSPKHRVILHFTALEMPDGREWDGGSHAYSNAASLVNWVGDAAQRAHVTLKGENALSGNLGSVGTSSTVGWSHIRDAFSGSPSAYSGLTILRLEDVTASGTARGEFERFIRDFH